MQGHTDKERIAMLEAKELINGEVVEEIKLDLKEINESVKKIELSMAKSMSFVGGIAFTFSLLGGFFVVMAKYLLSRLGIDI